MKEQTTWQEAFKITLIIMGWIIGFWAVFLTIASLIEHWYQIKMFFGYGGKIL